MIEINIPAFGLLRLEYALFDVNGTLALDGQLLPGVAERMALLKQRMSVMLISADTYGTLPALADALGVQGRRLQPGGEAEQKAAIVAELGAPRVAAIGNGANDVAMLRAAALGIAIMGGEGMATACLLASDIVADNILSALDLLLNPRRLLATLRA
ncbi:MAG: HAD family hydrolase [Chloroflexi bacterium]|nr:HAD family hydrolase [Chloroflexota bacterium]